MLSFEQELSCEGDPPVVLPIPDILGDVRSDIAAACYDMYNHYYVAAISGTSGKTIWKYETGAKPSALGFTSDKTGDGRPDVIFAGENYVVLLSENETNEEIKS